MGKYILRRLAMLVPVLLGVSFVVFLSLHLIPGNVVEVFMGTQSLLEPEEIRELCAELGLDKPLVSQYVTWLGRVTRGDMGTSLVTGRKIAPDILRGFSITVELTFLAIVLSILIGLPCGVLSAVRRDTVIDLVCRGLGLVGLSMPLFWMGAMLILLSSFTCPSLVPLGHFVRVQDNPGQNLRLMSLPAITASAPVAGIVMRTTRAAMLEVLRQKYVLTAKAKGLPGIVVLWKHVLRNAMIPIMTVIGMQAGYLFGGAVAVEEVFARPGVGRLVVRGIAQRDYPLVQAGVLCMTAAFALVNLVVDVLYAWVDPRIRYS